MIFCNYFRWDLSSCYYRLINTILEFKHRRELERLDENRKNLIRLPCNLIGFPIINMKRYNSLLKKVNEITNKANSYYRELFENRINVLTDAECLQPLELEY